MLYPNRKTDSPFAVTLDDTVLVCGQVYYPVRHHLVQHMISAMQRLGFTPSVTIEQRKLAVDLAEVVIKWELQRIKDQQVRHVYKPFEFPFEVKLFCEQCGLVAAGIGSRHSCWWRRHELWSAEAGSICGLCSGCQEVPHGYRCSGHGEETLNPESV